MRRATRKTIWFYILMPLLSPLVTHSWSISCPREAPGGTRFLPILGPFAALFEPIHGPFGAHSLPLLSPFGAPLKPTCDHFWTTQCPKVDHQMGNGLIQNALHRMYRFTCTCITRFACVCSTKICAFPDGFSQKRMSLHA